LWIRGLDSGDFDGEHVMPIPTLSYWSTSPAQAACDEMNQLMELGGALVVAEVEAEGSSRQCFRSEGSDRQRQS
jgi:hypothetical protein